MAVFVSYSSRDRALLDGLLAGLRRAREQVWIDEELTGGETWWRTILEQIRACEVFVVALSKNMLESKACQAELRYAQDLGKPILPVQVAALDNMRINPLAQMQMIDFRNPGIETGIELVSSVGALKAVSPPLPDPLPEEPPIPFAYLMRLASTISGPSLSAQQQTALVSELKAGLEEDGDDLSARRDLTQLLCMLRDRSDVTWRTRTEVEAVLASLGPSEAAQSSPPPPPGPDTGPMNVSGPFPMYSPPPGPGYGFTSSGASGVSGTPAKSKTKWLVIGGVAAVAAIAVILVVAVVALGGDNSKPTPPPAAAPPTVAAAALSSLLLTGDEIAGIVGVEGLEPGPLHNEMQSAAASVSKPECAGAQFNAVQEVYQGSGYSSVVTQALWSGDAAEPGYTWIGQTAVAFPSADQARAFLSTSTDQWKECAGETITVSAESDEHYNWTFDDVSVKDSQIDQKATQEGMGGYACQHVMRAVSNVIIEAAACNDRIADEADRIAERMTEKAQT